MEDDVIIEKVEPLFINNSTLTSDVCRTFLQVSWKVNGGYFRYILFFAAGFSALLGIFYLVRGGFAAIMTTGMFILIACAAVFSANYGWKLKEKKFITNQIKHWKSDHLDKLVFFYEDEFIQQSKLGETTLSYDIISNVTIEKGIILIWFGRSVLLMGSDQFEVGTTEEFQEFMKKILHDNKFHKKDKKTGEEAPARFKNN